MLSGRDKVVFSGFGAGLTWGAALLEWCKNGKNIIIKYKI